MGAFREQGDGGEQGGDLAGIVRVAEHRQGEGRLGHEDVAGDRLEGRAGRVAAALVVAGNDDALAGMLQHDLGRAEDMAGRHQPDRDIAQIDGFAIRRAAAPVRPRRRRSAPA